jgi:molybdopterin molybdotransferase
MMATNHAQAENPGQGGVGMACVATLDFDAALARLTAVVQPLGPETVTLRAAAGRILAAAVIARAASPLSDVAAMDGYALSAAGAAPPLRVIGQAFPGAPFPARVGDSEAVQVFTGAMIPAGTDRLAVQESVQSAGGFIVAMAVPAPGRHIRRKGSDFESGDSLLPQGRRIDCRALVAAAAAGSDEVLVARQPRLAIIATGSELVAPGSAASACSIPDTTSLAVAALATDWGAVLVRTERAPDRPDAIGGALVDATKAADVVVVTGGASVGQRDFCRAAVRALGGELVFADLAIKPGKPVWHAKIGSTHVLGLPGNPTAALTMARLFLAPLLCLLTGRQAADALAFRRAPFADAVSATGDREAFLCGAFDGERVRIVDRQSAASQARLAFADVLVRRPANAVAQPAGALATYLAF